MKREDLELYLDRGDWLGFTKQTGDDNYLGWIMLSKRKPNEQLLEILLEEERHELDDQQQAEKQQIIQLMPYQVLIIEMSREAYESDRYNTERDYRVNEAHCFPNLEEVERFIHKLGKTLSDIKWPIEIGAP